MKQTRLKRKISPQFHDKNCWRLWTYWTFEVLKEVWDSGLIPPDWRENKTVNFYKGKGDPLECGSFRGIRLLGHAIKIFKKVLDKRLRQLIKIDDMQFGFMCGRSATGTIFY